MPPYDPPERTNLFLYGRGNDELETRQVEVSILSELWKEPKKLLQTVVCVYCSITTVIHSCPIGIADIGGP